MFKKTKLIHEAEGKEVLIEIYVNINHICALLPGKDANQILIIMENNTKYTVKDDVKNLVGGGK